MKEIKCDVIRDLLPNYNDKISSEATNELVEEHLKYCPDCTQALENMNKEIDVEPLQNQEEIDYLKGYRKKKIKAIKIIFIVTIIIDILLGIFILYFCKDAIKNTIKENTNYFINVNDIEISYDERNSYPEEFGYVMLGMYYPKYDIKYEITRNENVVYIKVAGKEIENKYAMTHMIKVDVSSSTKSIYMEDRKGNIKKVWDKAEGPLVTIINPDFDIKDFSGAT